MKLPYVCLIITVVAAKPATHIGEERPIPNMEPLEIAPRTFVRDRKFLWPHGIVPYSFAPGNFSEEEQTVILKAMRAIEDVFKDNGFTDWSCQVKFVPRTDMEKDSSYLEFFQDGPDDCYSGVGRSGGRNKIALGTNCLSNDNVGTALHEICHALGFGHQHQSPDRDKYVKIVEDNVNPNYTYALAKYNETVYTDGGVPYDAKSIMQYSAGSYATDPGQHTIVSIDPNIEIPTIDINELSKGDWIKLHLLYCPNHTTVLPEKNLAWIEYNSTNGVYWVNKTLN